MEYIGFVFGIFGLLAYLQVSQLKTKVNELESQLAKIQGTSYHDDRLALKSAARKYIGETVQIKLKEDYMDADIVNYGNTKHGSNIILDVDEDWLLIQINGPKGSKEKLIRLEAIQNITVKQ